ncbi:MAG: signal peptidase II [Desulfobacteraceae bacterium 4572_130]|nr:MAG: signal peptidase II [Desulfobacteraceae bacterium 4572_130]
MKNNIILRLCLISGFIIIFDQTTKFFISKLVPLYKIIPVIDGFFNITYIMNKGGAFGIFANQSLEIRKFFFIFLSSIIAFIILWLYKKTAGKNLLFSLSLAAIFGGAVGNLIDRFRLGKVIDFLDFYIGNYHWPAFNIADSAITIGMVVFIYHVVFNKVPDL